MLGVTEAAAVPVMNHGRLLGVLWLRNGAAARPFDIGPLPEVLRVAGELGIALERSRTFAQERAKAEIDALTRLHNRRRVDRFLNQSFRQARESGRRFAVGLVDIDRFKRFNDSFGHQTGDDVLRIVADTMRSLTRPSDFLGRYGGEEFLSCWWTRTSRARCYAERIRQRSSVAVSYSRTVSGSCTTVSVGVATPRTIVVSNRRSSPPLRFGTVSGKKNRAQPGDTRVGRTG